MSIRVAVSEIPHSEFYSLRVARRDPVVQSRDELEAEDVMPLDWGRLAKIDRRVFAEQAERRCGRPSIAVPESSLLFQAGVSASLTPVTWSRLQVRGPTMATTLTPSQMAAYVDLSLDTP